MIPTRDQRIERAIDYHERTIHRPGRFARALGYLDWDTQPDPFRRYEGARLVPLERPAPGDDPALDDCYTVLDDPRPIDANSIAQLFFDSLALSAWKQFKSSRWSLRCNPSSGNLHPTEAYLVGRVPGLLERPALAHYTALTHALEVRAEGPPLPEGLAVGLTSIHWREAWKYGERAYRYCQHDAGHAVAALAFAAAALGWRVRMIEAADPDLSVLLGIDRQSGIEAEHPDLLLAIGPKAAHGSWRPDPETFSALASIERAGVENVLSHDHHEWPVIDEVSLACRLDAPPEPSVWRFEPVPAPKRRGVSARKIYRSRRSAVALDGRTRMSAEDFYRVVSRVMPGRVPFDTFWWPPAIHPVFFVHRVDDVRPGAYVLVRRPDAEPALRAALAHDFDWERPAGCPEHLPLYRLGEGDVRPVAQLVACQQAIAADGCFAVAMLGELRPGLVRHGAWFYRRLHFEAGALGHVLYLEAEAIPGLRGTGIGCFFDELIGEALGLDGAELAPIYCFTIGGPVDDTRIQSAPAYPADR